MRSPSFSRADSLNLRPPWRISPTPPPPQFVDESLEYVAGLAGVVVADGGDAACVSVSVIYAWNRLIEVQDDAVTVARYTYDGRGFRIAAAVSDILDAGSRYEAGQATGTFGTQAWYFG